MIFRDQKLIFLHIPRTGGTIVEMLLTGLEDPSQAEATEGVWNKHWDAARAEVFWPEFSDPEYRVAAIVRHPLDLVASQYIQSRLNPSVRGLNAWVRRCLDEGRPLYQTSAEVDGYMPELLPPAYKLSSAGQSQARFLSCGRIDLYLFRFETLKRAIRQIARLAGMRPPRQLPESGVRQPDEFPNIPRDEDGRIAYRSLFARDVKRRLATQLEEDFALWRNAR